MWSTVRHPESSKYLRAFFPVLISHWRAYLCSCFSSDGEKRFELNRAVAPAALMFAPWSSIRVHKLDIPTGRYPPAVHPRFSQQHQRFTTLDKFRRVQIKSRKMHNKDVRCQQLFCSYWSALLTDMHTWPAWFQTTGAFCCWIFARQNMYFWSHKQPRLIPLCDGHFLHLLFSIIWVSWTKSII